MSALLFEILAVTRFAVGSSWSDLWRALKVTRETTGFSLYWVEWTVNNVARNTAHYSTHWQLMSVSDTSMTQLTQRQTDRQVTCLPLTRMAVIDGARLSTTFVSRLEQNLTTALPHTDTHTRGLRHWCNGYLLSMCLLCRLTWTTTDVTQPDTWGRRYACLLSGTLGT